MSCFGAHTPVRWRAFRGSELQTCTYETGGVYRGTVRAARAGDNLAFKSFGQESVKILAMVWNH